MESLPDELEKILTHDPGLRRAFESLSASEKQHVTRWIESATHPEHRRKRIDMVIQMVAEAGAPR